MDILKNILIACFDINGIYHKTLHTYSELWTNIISFINGLFMVLVT